MPTPTTNTNYVTTTYDLIKMAFSLINTFGADEEIDAHSYQMAERMLNMLIKLWMDKGYNLWLKETAYLFTRMGQNTYNIYLGSPDHCTLKYYSTTVGTTALAAATSVTVTSAANITVGDNIGIILDSNDIFWTTAYLIAGNVISFPAGVTLPSQSTIGNTIYNYTTGVDLPLNIYEAVRNDDGLRDVPMNFLSYDEYFRLPNKLDTTSTPVSFMYNRQLSDCIITLWPTPDKSNVIVKLLIGQRIYNVANNSDEPEFPNEWQLPIAYNLAVLLAPAYGKNKDAGFQMLKAMADETLATALAFDNEVGSIFIKPNMYNA